MKEKYLVGKLLSFISIVFIMFVLVCCGRIDSNKRESDFSDAFESIEEEVLIFYDPSAKMLLKSFIEKHPEIKVEGVALDQFLSLEDGSLLDGMIELYGSPDLILGGFIQGAGDFSYIDINDLSGCYKKGYIADIGQFLALDQNLDTTAYFPGTFEVFQDKDHIYAIPLGITLDFMLTTESKYNNSHFSELKEGYTGEELLDILEIEVKEERSSEEFFCTENFSFARLLYQLGGVKRTSDGIQIDEDLFKQLYEFISLSNKHTKETKRIWVEDGKRFTIDSGFIEITAFEPRTYENKFIVNLWKNSDAPIIALSYATTANRYHLDEDTKAIYIPLKVKGDAYNATVKVYGAIGEDSRRKELAYNILRMMMDEETLYFSSPSGFSWPHPCNLYPVNIEKARGLLDNFENRNATLLYGHMGSGRYLQVLDIVKIDEEEREKHQKMLKGIEGLFYWDNNMAKISNIFNDYQSANIKDYKGCYDEIMKILNSKV